MLRQVCRFIVDHDRVHGRAIDNRSDQLVDACRAGVNAVDEQQICFFVADVTVLHGCGWLAVALRGVEGF